MAIKRKAKDFTPDTRNANKGTVRGLAMLEDSLRKYGAGRSILVDKNNNIIAGNKTHQAAIDLGLDDVIVVPTDGKQLVVVQRVDIDIDSKQGRELALADNRVGQVDLEFDPSVLSGFADEGIDLAQFWNDDELAALLGDDGGDDKPAPDAQMDKADELQKKWRVERGDLWQIGDHRLLCGDSTNADDVARVMAGEKADAIMADAPYGMALDTDWSDRVGTWDRNVKAYSPVENDDKPFNRASIPIEAQEEFWWGADYYVDTLPNYGKDGSWIVWDKRHEGALDEMRGNAFELCWSKDKHKRELIRVTWVGVLGHNKKEDGDLKFHPTQKPVKLVRELVSDYTRTSMIVVDPFGGSGTTMVACQQLSRRCRMIEISEKYCAVILERLSAMGITPQKVTHG